MEIEFLVVRKKDAESPVEIIGFSKDCELEAVNLFENMQINWTECYFCNVVNKANLPIQKAFNEHVSIKSELDRLKQENDTLEHLNNRSVEIIEDKDKAIDQLQQNQAKLIEALKPFANYGDMITKLFGNQYTSTRPIPTESLVRASQAMKEVCGEEKKD